MRDPGASVSCIDAESRKKLVELWSGVVGELRMTGELSFRRPRERLLYFRLNNMLLGICMLVPRNVKART